MDLEQIRTQIDDIDNDLVRLFQQRMTLVKQVAQYKQENNMPVLNSAREREIISRLTKDQDNNMAQYTKAVFTTLFDVSRTCQSNYIKSEDILQQQVEKALAQTDSRFPTKAVVACQGIEGANSQFACERLFSCPSIVYMNNFEAVFAAVEQGLCDYGILPIENSLHGLVPGVYDLMKEYQCYISKAAKIQINHVLLANKGASISDIKEIYSHEQALAQCSLFLNALKDVKIIPCENTAVAAKKVLESNRGDIAAISSKACSELYGLTILDSKIQNSDNNYTRFICISKKLEIYPGANKISIILSIPHRPGSLYQIISKFAACGLNLTKLESRPIQGSDFEFLFYVDLEGDVRDEQVQSVLNSLKSEHDFFAFLGNYMEI